MIGVGLLGILALRNRWLGAVGCCHRETQRSACYGRSHGARAMPVARWGLGLPPFRAHARQLCACAREKNYFRVYAATFLPPRRGAGGWRVATTGPTLGTAALYKNTPKKKALGRRQPPQAQRPRGGGERARKRTTFLENFDHPLTATPPKHVTTQCARRTRNARTSQVPARARVRPLSPSPWKNRPGSAENTFKWTTRGAISRPGARSGAPVWPRSMIP